MDLYDAVEYLGGGGFGDAYLSKVKETNESLVVKILKKSKWIVDGSRKLDQDDLTWE